MPALSFFAMPSIRSAAEVKARNQRRLRRLRRVGGRAARVLQGGDFLLEPAHLLVGFDRSSATVIAAITISRASPISPN